MRLILDQQAVELLKSGRELHLALHPGARPMKTEPPAAAAQKIVRFVVMAVLGIGFVLGLIVSLRHFASCGRHGPWIVFAFVVAVAVLAAVERFLEWSEQDES
jgi:hypothetical protein